MPQAASGAAGPRLAVMTPDEARKLPGGYATGSLTEAERAALFEAALHDQDLFDELSGEQVLKEVLDEPGARQRLLAALEPPAHRAAWWLWPSAAAAVTLAVVILLMVSNRTIPPPPQQIAQVTKSPEPEAVPPTRPPPAPKPRLRQPQLQEPSPPPPPPPAAKPPTEERELLVDKLEADASARGGAVGGFGGARSKASALRAENAVVSVPSGFAFNYAVRADGYLEIVPAARGFLSVTAHDAVIFPSGAVSAGTPLRIPIPADAASLVIGFSVTPGITGSPVRRDGAAGTVTDQDPPNGRIIIELFLTPATR
jgi:hypothetical protein